MGSFSEIVRRDDQDSRKNFSLGVGFNINSTFLDVFLEFKESGSEASLSIMTLLFPQGGKLIFEVASSSESDISDSRHRLNGFHIDTVEEDHFVIKMAMEDLLFHIRGFPYYLERILKRRKADSKGNKLRKFLLQQLSLSGQEVQVESVIHQLFRDLPEVISMVPIRSKPQRTYDHLTETKTLEGSQVNVHNIEFDETGNLLNAPDSYQQFFLDESDRFLGFKD